MIVVRPASERGLTELGWLESRHSFSFGDYHDDRHMGFQDLRVINEDRVRPGQGFGTHGHRDMEIVSYVLEGALEHKDSMGNGSVIRPGDVQRMSAGTGVMHSEFNPSSTDSCHFLQIWILPERRGMSPGYEQRGFAPDELRGALRRVAGPDGGQGAVTIHQDASMYAGRLERGHTVAHALGAGRYAWLQVARGAVALNGTGLKAGDGASVSGEPRLEIRALESSEVILFDLR